MLWTAYLCRQVIIGQVVIVIALVFITHLCELLLGQGQADQAGEHQAHAEGPHTWQHSRINGELLKESIQTLKDVLIPLI